MGRGKRQRAQCGSCRVHQEEEEKKEERSLIKDLKGHTQLAPESPVRQLPSEPKEALLIGPQGN